MNIFETVSILMAFAPRMKNLIDMGTPLIEELKKAKPQLIPILEKLGADLFPNLKDPIHAVAAAADALFDPNGTRKLQTSLNTLMQANLKVDGVYGTATKKAVEAFQTAHQPEAGTVDGWSGPITEAVLLAELNKLNVK